MEGQIHTNYIEEWNPGIHTNPFIISIHFHFTFLNNFTDEESAAQTLNCLFYAAESHTQMLFCVWNLLYK